jgi:hypothetical protein
METFKKRQKEMRRLEKRRDKIAKRQAKKAGGGDQPETSQEPETDTPVTPTEEVSQEVSQHTN